MESTGRRNVRGRISIGRAGAGPRCKSRELEVKVDPETVQGVCVVTTVQSFTISEFKLMP